MTAHEPSGAIVVEGWLRTSGDSPIRKGPLTIVVDGHVMQGRFAQPERRPVFGLGPVFGNRIAVAAGTHQVKIFYSLRRKEEAGVAQVQVDVATGAECRLHYGTNRLSLRLKGQIKVNPAAWRPPEVFVELGSVAG